MNWLRLKTVRAICFFVVVLPRVVSAESADPEWIQDLALKRTKASAAFTQLMNGVDSLEVFTLDPSARIDDADKEQTNSSKLDGWKVQQRFNVTDRQEIDRLISGLRVSLETGGPVARCFEPRHALRFAKDGREVLVIVCFQCGSMKVKGCSDFDGGAVGPAAAKDFYLSFQARGVTKPNRLAGLNDAEIAKRLVGTWKGRRTDGTETLRIRTETLKSDGTYTGEMEITFPKKGGTPVRYSSKGKWLVQDSMLILSEPDDSLPNVPVESWRPLMEISDSRYLVAPIASESDMEQLWERVR